MTKRVVFTNAKGGVTIEKPMYRFVEEMKTACANMGVPLTDAQAAAATCGKALALHKGTDPCLCDEADIPTDRTFRNAWERGKDKPVTVSMEKAKPIAENIIRAERAPLFTELDKQFSIAQGKKDQEAADAVEAKRQKLRDAPADKRLADAADPDALKAALVAVVTEMKA